MNKFTVTISNGDVSVTINSDNFQFGLVFDDMTYKETYNELVSGKDYPSELVFKFDPEQTLEVSSKLKPLIDSHRKTWIKQEAGNNDGFMTDWDSK